MPARTVRYLVASTISHGVYYINQMCQLFRLLIFACPHIARLKINAALCTQSHAIHRPIKIVGYYKKKLQRWGWKKEVKKKKREEVDSQTKHHYIKLGFARRRRRRMSPASQKPAGRRDARLWRRFPTVQKGRGRDNKRRRDANYREDEKRYVSRARGNRQKKREIKQERETEREIDRLGKRKMNIRERNVLENKIDRE